MRRPIFLGLFVLNGNFGPRTV